MLSRREFLRKCRDVSVLMCGSTLFTRTLAEGFIRLANDPPPLAFIHAQNCMGCTTSLMYGNDFDFVDVLSHVGRLEAHPSLSFVQGRDYLDNLARVTREGGHILIVEGSIPSSPKEACFLGDSPLFDVLGSHAASARMIISAGSCASHGRIPASGGARTGAISVAEYLRRADLEVPLLQIPGCPIHPDHLMGSIAYTVSTGKFPPLVKGGLQPAEYFEELIHNHCSRFQHFTQDLFVEDFARDKKKCLLKKGCRGPITYSDCPLRRWNNRTSVCIDSNKPCIGCMNEQWPFKQALYLDTTEVEDLPWSQMKQKIRQR